MPYKTLDELLFYSPFYSDITLALEKLNDWFECLFVILSQDEIGVGQGVKITSETTKDNFIPKISSNRTPSCPKLVETKKSSGSQCILMICEDLFNLHP